MKRYWTGHKLLLTLALLLCTAEAFFSTFISLLLQRVTDAALTRDMNSFLRLLIFTGLYMAVLCLVSFLGSLSGKYLLQKMTLDMRRDIYRGIMAQSFTDFSSRSTADYLSALINDVKLIEDNYILPLLQTIQMAVMFLASLGLLLSLSPVITGVLAASLVLMFLVPALLGRILSKRQEAVSAQMAAFTEKTKDILSGFEVIHSYRRFSYMAKKFETQNRNTARCRFAADKVLSLSEGLSDTLSSLSIVVVIFASAFLLIKGSITAGTLLALLQLSGTFMAPLLIIMENLPKMRGIAPVAKRLCDLSGDPDKAEAAETTEKKSPVCMETSLAAENLSFGYREDAPVLHQVSLTIEKNKKYALVGPSGCGKSTLIRLLTGCYRDYSGIIACDGSDIKELTGSFPEGLAASIHQNVYLFDDTVRENIALGETFSQQAWDIALSQSGMKDVLNALPQGLSGRCGEGGSLLSGGQKQKVALARALIRNRQFLILDEGTSAIDKKTAVEIEESLLSKPELTLLSITHALSSQLLAKYDQVIFMGEGQIKAAGPYGDLIKNCAEFREFCGISEVDDI